METRVASVTGQTLVPIDDDDDDDDGDDDDDDGDDDAAAAAADDDDDDDDDDDVVWRKVSPVELESVLRQHPDVLDAAVVSVRDDVDGDLPRALVVPSTSHIRPQDVVNFVNGLYIEDFLWTRQ